MQQTQPAWWFNEFQHIGVDFDQTEAVESYSAKQGTRSEDERALIESLGIAPQHRVLEFGCGTGVFSLEAAQHSQHVYAVDISKPMLAHVQDKAAQAGIENLTLIHGGFLSYVHAAAPVDYIVTKYAFHHLPDFWKSVALNRLAQMLKPRGKLYLEDVIFSFAPDSYEESIKQWIARVVKPDQPSFSTGDFEMHVREEYSSFDWIIEGLLERSGFEIEQRQIRNSEYASYLAVRRS